MRAPRYGRRTVVTTESVQVAALGTSEAPPAPRVRRRRGSAPLAEELRARRLSRYSIGTRPAKVTRI